jgi:hypothetical protein
MSESGLYLVGPQAHPKGNWQVGVSQTVERHTETNASVVLLVPMYRSVAP